MNELVAKPRSRTVASAASTIAVPAVIAGAGEHAARRFLEFFAATIRNRNTRMAYYRAACSFFAWVEQHHIGELADRPVASEKTHYLAPNPEFDRPGGNRREGLDEGLRFFTERITGMREGCDLPPRPKRWTAAVAALIALQDEYRAWLDNLPDNLEGSRLADKLQAIAEVDLEELHAIDPPRGYGRD